MSLWINSNPENEPEGIPPWRGRTLGQGAGGRAFYTYVLVALVALTVGLIIGQLTVEYRIAHSRIQWPAPELPHPRTLPR